MEHPLNQFKYCPKCGSAAFEIHNEKSKQCTDCGFVYYFNPSSATVALILKRKDELLVCRRAKEPAKGTLDLPGGFIDMNETGEEGVSREVEEETGLKVKRQPTCFPFRTFISIPGFLYIRSTCFSFAKWKIQVTLKQWMMWRTRFSSHCAKLIPKSSGWALSKRVKKIPEREVKYIKQVLLSKL